MMALIRLLLLLQVFSHLHELDLRYHLRYL
jgi:ABC-type transport system involved in Fe-S cluster assembly fused permease/ATPase subunit